MLYKVRENQKAARTACALSGSVEVDGAYFGGCVKPANEKKDRKDRRKEIHQSGKRQSVIIMRERGGRTLTYVTRTEAEGVALVAANVEHCATVHADEASHRDKLDAYLPIKRISPQVAYSKDGACTNQAESFFSRLRRAEVGTHHHIAGKYLGAYEAEMARRKHTNRQANGTQFTMAIGPVSAVPVSRQWARYWKSHTA